MTIAIGRAAIRRVLLASLGMLCIALGVIGVFVPGLPTTEFLLAASYLFARSSPTFSAWLESHRWVGPSLRRFRETNGMSGKAKALALTSMWTGLAISVSLLTQVGAAAQLIAISFGIVGSATILFAVRTTAARQSLILS
jgi:uncharacterized protein